MLGTIDAGGPKAGAGRGSPAATRTTGRRMTVRLQLGLAFGALTLLMVVVAVLIEEE